MQISELVRTDERIIPSVEAMDDVANSADGGLISGATARTIASLYQSPGSIGSDLATFASTGQHDREALLDDIAATIRTERHDDDGIAALEALRNWVRQS